MLENPDKSTYQVYSSTHQYLHDSHSHLLGRILTLVDATFVDAEQRKAFKDLVKSEFNDGWNDDMRDIIYSQFCCVANLLGDKDFNRHTSSEDGKLIPSLADSTGRILQ